MDKSFFASLKREEIYCARYKSERQFQESIDHYIDFYNSQWLHNILAYKMSGKSEEIYNTKHSKEGLGWTHGSKPIYFISSALNFMFLQNK